MKAEYVLIVAFSILAQSSIALADDSSPAQQFQGFNLEGYTQDGKKSWVVNGSKADILGDVIQIADVDAESYMDEKVNLVSQVGTINQVSGNIHLEKDVVVTGERGVRLSTDSLDWDRNKDLVQTQDPVTITDKDMTLTGQGMQAHPALKTAKIEKDVKVVMDTAPAPEESKIVTITSSGPMTIDQAKSYAVFEDQVVAAQEDQTLQADRMEIYFDEEKKQIKEMICTGNVILIRGENKSFSDKAVYDGTQRRLTLSGRPKLILLTEGNDVFTSLGN